MDLRPVIEDHIARGSTATLVTAEVTKKEASDNVAVLTGRGGVVTDLEVKVSRPSTGTVATEIFVYRIDALLDALTTLRAELDDATDDDDSGLGDFGEHLLPRLIETGTVHAVPIDGYWRDLGQPHTYLQGHRDLLAGKIDVFDHPGRPVDLPLARPTRGAGAAERPADRQPALARVRRGRRGVGQRAGSGRRRGEGRPRHRLRDLRRRRHPVGRGRADRRRRRGAASSGVRRGSARSRPLASPATRTSCSSGVARSWSRPSPPVPGSSRAPARELLSGSPATGDSFASQGLQPLRSDKSALSVGRV